MTRLAPLALAVCLCSNAAAALDGTWKATRYDTERGRIDLNLSYTGTENLGTGFALAALDGLSAGQVDAATETPVRFSLEREAGRVVFEGSFREGRGKGRFTFVGQPAYFEAVRKLGVDDSVQEHRGRADEAEERLLAMALLDVSTDYMRGLISEGYRESLDKYLAMRIFDVTPEHIRSLRELGLEDLTSDELVATRIHGVTPEFVRETRDAGWELSFDELMAARIHGVTPQFRAEMAELGYDVSFDQLTAFRIHGVTPEWIAELRELGYDRLDADDLVSTRIFGVTAEFIRSVEAAGYRYLPMSELISMRIRGIDADDLPGRRRK